MSLAIDTDQITAVLLPDGMWHAVASGSFDLDDGYWLVLRGGQERPAAGFVFRKPGGGWVVGPMGSVLAARTSAAPELDEPDDEPQSWSRVTSPDRGDR